MLEPVRIDIFECIVDGPPQLEEVMFFDSIEQASEFCLGYNSGNVREVPGWHTCAKIHQGTQDVF